MSSFKMKCPKCESLSYSIERDPRNYAQRGQTAELIFSCRCGKQLFGDQIQAESDRQQALYDAEMATPSQEEIERRQAAKEREERERALREAFEYQSRYLVEKRKADSEAARLREEARLREWKERVARQGQVPDITLPEPAAPKESTPAVAGQGCEWPGCGNVARAGSKYCSRECSNKNARARHKQRVKVT